MEYLITPSPHMISEGIAREVINKIQKLRKKSLYLNLAVVPGSRLVGGDFRATLLLENPLGQNTLTYTQLQAEVR